MAHAEICPVCGGKAEIGPSGDSSDSTCNDASLKQCHGCLGWGWVTVQDGNESPSFPFYFYDDPETPKTRL